MNSDRKAGAGRILEWACSVYVLSLLVVIPFMTWKDTIYVVAIILMGYGLGRWKGSEYDGLVLPLAVAYLAAKPFLHYGPHPTGWSWQRYSVVAATGILLIVFLGRSPVFQRRLWERLSLAFKDWPRRPTKAFLPAILVALACLAGSVAVPLTSACAT